MIIRKIDLYAHFNVERKEGCSGYLTCYLLNDYAFAKDRIRPAMLVVAGGGYSHLSDREMEPVAMKYLESGFSCFVLEYSLAPAHYPTQVLEGAMAMAYIRENAETLGVDKDRVVALGFSAGAHLCGMLATVQNDEIPQSVKAQATEIRPSAVVLGYPVVSAYQNPHAKSFLNISGGDETLYAKLSIENRVKGSASPAFMWGALDDPVVSSDNGFALAQAYKRSGVAFEYHLFESCNGVHGLSVCEKETLYENETVGAWLRLSKRWLKNRGFEIR